LFWTKVNTQTHTCTTQKCNNRLCCWLF